MDFLEDPRLRQRWNQISHNAEAATETAAFNIWTFQHRYLAPCVAHAGAVFETLCITPCAGDSEERARRRRERERARGRAEYSFDFYDDWYADYDEHNFDRATGESLGGRLFGRWRGEDWDRLVAGSGAVVGPDTDPASGARARTAPAAVEEERLLPRGGGGDVTEQPRLARGMSYGTREVARRRGPAQDPTIIPSTQALGFLAKLPFRIGGPLRYRPSAADLQEHPVRHLPETEPLLGPDDILDDEMR